MRVAEGTSVPGHQTRIIIIIIIIVVVAVLLFEGEGEGERWRRPVCSSSW